MDPVQTLMGFGLTQQEAKLYILLHSQGKATGYELAKLAGISRSNAYGSLSTLVEKGGAYLIDGKPAVYQAVPVADFCRHAIRRLEKAATYLENALQTPVEEGAAYLTVKGRANVLDKIFDIIADTKLRIYISMGEETLVPFLPELEKLAKAGRKVVVITDRPVELDGATVYLADEPVTHIRLISDTSVALTGVVDDSESCSCLYSNKKNLVDLLRDSMRNEIRLIAFGKNTSE